LDSNLANVIRILLDFEFQGLRIKRLDPLDLIRILGLLERLKSSLNLPKSWLRHAHLRIITIKVFKPFNALLEKRG
jgi:hypothetical protein